MTDRYGVIGRPVAHSRSPFIHAQFAAQFGQQIDYTRIDCAPGEFDERVMAFFESGGLGLNVTMPHKQAAFALVSRLGVRARIANAVNVIGFSASGDLMGDNTDGTGLVRDLVRNLRIGLRDSRILLLGAGGAARGVAAPLLGQRPESLTIANRTFERALALVEQVGGFGKVRARHLEGLAGERFDLIINATSAGLANEAPVIGCALDKTICYDMTYDSGPTPFMRWARAAGARDVHDGWGMLVEQAAESFYIWRQLWPDTARLIEQRPR